MKVILDLSNYATKSDKKRATGVNTSKSAKNVDLACLKSNVEKLRTGFVIYLFIPFLKLTKKHTVFLQWNSYAMINMLINVKFLI